MGVTMSQLQEGIKVFAQKLSSQPLGLAHHQPYPNSVPANCISNALTIKADKGGAVRYGWYFLHKMSPEFGDYLIATHHAVWHNPSDQMLIDVTPYHPEEKHRPIAPDGDLLFLLDDNAKPIKLENALAPLPSRFYPLSKKIDLAGYVEKLQKEEYEFYKQQYGIDFE